MKYSTISGEQFYAMVQNASNKLESQSEYVNSLNVFPVPDGDTGTNMSMTFKAAAKEIAANKNGSIDDVSKKLAKGALMGARGNSGVILSQILRGMSKGFEGVEEAEVKDFVKAIEEGAKSAYKAVMRPTEGTILTIIRAAAEKAGSVNASDIETLMTEVVKECKIMLDKTPEMLPALKKAGVVDSGGMGLLIILEGMLESLKNGLKIDHVETVFVENNIAKHSAQESISEDDIKFAYCTEFIILGDATKAESFKNQIESLGDSMIVVGYEDVIKTHIHTNDPGRVLSMAVQLGELSNIKIDNMKEEHREILAMNEEGATATEVLAHEVESVDEIKKFGFVSVAMGTGITEIFRDLGVDYVIEGGQTMNPSTQDILDAIEKINAEYIFVLPNNKNIIMAANQAAEVSEKEIIVIPTITVPQGITAVTMFNPAAEVEANVETLNEAIKSVKSASVTYAVRDTEMDGIEIKEGNILGLLEGKIKEVGSSEYDVAKDLIENMTDEDSELITIFYGADCDETKVEELVAELEDKYEEFDIQCYKGNQPLYYFIISVE
ncbi:MAG: DAK2 domain-containing protein [Sarcina sp.]